MSKSELDISRAPRGVLAAQSLVVAVAERGDLVERHYLELKSTLDPSTKKDKEKIAKFILGASNRMPETAATAFEGYAAMVVGVSKGSIAGIPPVEMMKIAKIVQQYVGAAGPRWDILWVPIEGSANQVLVVLVDPPMAGQGPFPCRSSGDSLTDGRIYSSSAEVLPRRSRSTSRLSCSARSHRSVMTTTERSRSTCADRSRGY